MDAANMTDTNDNITLTHAIAKAWLSNPHTHASADAAATFLRDTYATISNLGVTGGGAATAPHEEDTTGYAPAVSVRKSLANPEFIISMIDGKPYRSLGRHLSSRGLTPEDYRKRYNLKADYPLVAPSYRKARSEQAIQLGLGRKPAGAVEKAVEAVAEPVKAVAKRARKSISEAKRAAQEHLRG
jgi:predicted transcriptional regulator